MKTEDYLVLADTLDAMADLSIKKQKVEGTK